MNSGTHVRKDMGNAICQGHIHGGGIKIIEIV